MADVAAASGAGLGRLAGQGERPRQAESDEEAFLVCAGRRRERRRGRRAGRAAGMLFVQGSEGE